MSYDEFLDACYQKLLSYVCDAWKPYMADYIRLEENEELIRWFYKLGTERYMNNPKHDKDLAFNCCISDVAENLRLLYDGEGMME